MANKFSFTNTLVLSCMVISIILICISISLNPLKNLINGIKINNFEIVNISSNMLIILISLIFVFSSTIKTNIVKIIQIIFNGIINTIEKMF